MKKAIYVLLGLVIIGGIAFALSNTNLFKGAFVSEPDLNVGDDLVYELTDESKARTEANNAEGHLAEAELQRDETLAISELAEAASNNAIVAYAAEDAVEGNAQAALLEGYVNDAQTSSDLAQDETNAIQGNIDTIMAFYTGTQSILDSGYEQLAEQEGFLIANQSLLSDAEGNLAGVQTLYDQALIDLLDTSYLIVDLDGTTQVYCTEGLGFTAWTENDPTEPRHACRAPYVDLLDAAGDLASIEGDIGILGNAVQGNEETIAIMEGDILILEADVAPFLTEQARAEAAQTAAQLAADDAAIYLTDTIDALGEATGVDVNAPTCGNGLDDDEDGTADVFGACDASGDGLADTACSDNPTYGGGCQNYCQVNGWTFIEADNSCSTYNSYDELPLQDTTGYIKVHVKNQVPENLTTLDDSNFFVTEADPFAINLLGETNLAENIASLGNGEYSLEVPTTGIDYDVEIRDLDGHKNKTEIITAANDINNAVLTEIIPKPGYRIRVRDEAADTAITSASVTLDSVDCKFLAEEVEDDAYGCYLPIFSEPLPTEITGQISADGYITKDITFTSIRVKHEETRYSKQITLNLDTEIDEVIDVIIDDEEAALDADPLVEAADTELACTSLDILPNIYSISVEDANAGANVELTVNITSGEINLTKLTPSWLDNLFASIFGSNEVVLSSEDIWEGTLVLETSGSGDFSANDILVSGDSSTTILNYNNLQIGDIITASVGTNCSDTLEITELDDVQTGKFDSLASGDCTHPFTDIASGIWYEEEVCGLYENDVVSGKTYNFYDGPADVTLAEALKILLEVAEIDVNLESTGVIINHPDVNSGDWFYDYIRVAEDMNVLRTPSGATVYPNAPATRSQIVIWAARLWNLTTYDYDVTQYCSDIINTDPYAYAFALTAGETVDVPGSGVTAVTTGYSDGTCKPNNPINRAEMSAWAIRFYLLGGAL